MQIFWPGPLYPLGRIYSPMSIRSILHCSGRRCICGWSVMVMGGDGSGWWSIYKFTIQPHSDVPLKALGELSYYTCPESIPVYVFRSVKLLSLLFYCFVCSVEFYYVSLAPTTWPFFTNWSSTGFRCCGQNSQTPSSTYVRAPPMIGRVHGKVILKELVILGRPPLEIFTWDAYRAKSADLLPFQDLLPSSMEVANRSLL